MGRIPDKTLVLESVVEGEMQAEIRIRNSDYGEVALASTAANQT